MSRCELEWIGPEFFVDLVHVSKLDLSYNRLSALSSFGQCHKLEVMLLASNCFKEVPEAILDVPSLLSLDLSSNSLAVLPPQLTRLGRLAVLLLDKNCLEFVDGGVFNMPSVNVMRMQHNKLTSLPPLTVSPRNPAHQVRRRGAPLMNYAAEEISVAGNPLPKNVLEHTNLPVWLRALPGRAWTRSDGVRQAVSLFATLQTITLEGMISSKEPDEIVWLRILEALPPELVGHICALHTGANDLPENAIDAMEEMYRFRFVGTNAAEQQEVHNTFRAKWIAASACSAAGLNVPSRPILHSLHTAVLGIAGEGASGNLITRTQGLNMIASLEEQLRAGTRSDFLLKRSRFHERVVWWDVCSEHMPPIARG